MVQSGIVLMVMLDVVPRISDLISYIIAIFGYVAYVGV